jgi:hypothetical protein
MLEASMKMKLFYPIRPWENEPDHAEWIQEVSGYKCRISRMEGSGALCGYVGIPKDNVFWGVIYDEGNEELDAIADDVHGGFTYTEEGKDGWWYFGFDTNHYDDFAPAIAEALIKNGIVEEDIKYSKYHDCMNYKTWEFVEDQIHWLGKRLWQYNEYHKNGCRNV